MSDPIGQLRQPLAAAGFDLVAGTTVQAYNHVAPQGYWLPDLGRTNTLAVVIGNTAALWPALGRIWDQPEYQDDPVDRYTTATIRAAVDGVDLTSEIFYAFEPPPRRIAIQRLAHIAGLAWLSPSHLCVHPVFGPWIALRAAVVFDAAGPETSPIDPPCDCALGCLPAFEQALAAGEPSSKVDLANRWEAWVAFRAACPVGIQHRYSDEQTRYHYTEDSSARPPIPS